MKRDQKKNNDSAPSKDKKRNAPDEEEDVTTEPKTKRQALGTARFQIADDAEIDDEVDLQAESTSIKKVDAITNVEKDISMENAYQSAQITPLNNRFGTYGASVPIVPKQCIIQGTPVILPVSGITLVQKPKRSLPLVPGYPLVSRASSQGHPEGALLQPPVASGSKTSGPGANTNSISTQPTEKNIEYIGITPDGSYLNLSTSLSFKQFIRAVTPLLPGYDFAEIILYKLDSWCAMSTEEEYTTMKAKITNIATTRDNTFVHFKAHDMARI